MQANSSSKKIDLGGRNYMCLRSDLVCIEHVSISNATPFILHSCLLPLVLLFTAILIELLELKYVHSECKILCLECKNVEKSLLWHIQEAIEEKDIYYFLINAQIL